MLDAASRFLNKKVTKTQEKHALTRRKVWEWCDEWQIPVMEMDPSLCVIYLSQRVMEVKSKQLAMEVKANSKAWVVLKPGQPNPWQSEMVGEALKNACSPRDVEHMVRWPLTMAHLLKLKELVWQKGKDAPYVMVRDVCSVWLAFYAMLRCAEVARLWLDQVRVDRGGATAVVRVWVKTSKTDQDGKGEWIACVSEDLAEMVERYLRVRGTFAGPFLLKQPDYVVRTKKSRAQGMEKKRGLVPAKGKMFLPQQKSEWKKRPQPGTTGQKQQAEKEREQQAQWGLSKATLTHRLRDLLKQVGITDQDRQYYSWHSCRAGGATEAIRQGVSIEELSRQGRWKSKAVEVYVWLQEKEAGQATKDFGKGLEQADLATVRKIQQHQPTVPLVPYSKRH